jgi:hypothetical protein
MIKYKAIVESWLANRFKSFMNRDLVNYRRPQNYDITRVYLEYNSANIYYDKYSGLHNLHEHIEFAQSVNNALLLGSRSRLANMKGVDLISHDATIYLPCTDFAEVEEVFRSINEFIVEDNYEINIAWWSKFDVINDGNMDIAIINIVINVYQLACDADSIILIDHIDVNVSNKEEL